MQGNLAKDQLPELIRSLNHDEESGVLCLSRGNVSKEIYFGKGSMIFACSNYRDDRLGEFLVRNGKMTKTHLELASQKVNDTGLRLGAVMVTMGLMTESEMLARVDDQLRAIIYSVFPWSHGEYCFRPKDNPVASDMARDLATYPIILEGIRRLKDPAIIERALGSLDRIVNCTKDQSSLTGEIQLTPEESYVLSRVDGHVSVADIIAISPIEEERTLQCLYGLLSVGVLELGKKSRELTPSIQTVRVTSPGDAAPSPSGNPPPTGTSDQSPEEQWIRQDIISKFTSLLRGTYYDWLEVRRMANEGEIKKSFRSLIMTYHPDRLCSSDLEDLRGHLEEIISKITTAFEALSDPVARRRYDNSLRTEAPRGEDLSPRTETTSTSKEKGGEDTPKKTAENYYREAKRCFAEGDYHLTSELLDISLRLDPSNPSYHKLQGKALGKNPNWRKDAEEHFQTALEDNPFDVECLVELGEIYEAAGLARKAERMYFRALGLDPENEQLKEKLMQKKQPPKWMSWLKILQH